MYRKKAFASDIISIHALREEGDLRYDLAGVVPRPISIHALREEGDPGFRTKLCRFRFLSTPSARRATRQAWHISICTTHFYPRPPRGGRPEESKKEEATEYFYPRPPRGGRRTMETCLQRASKFLSTPSARRATLFSYCSVQSNVYFYPRPPRGGRPWQSLTRKRACSNFYPRPPRGGRPFLSVIIFYHISSFLSTPSARRAT